MSDHEISVRFAHCPLFRAKERIDNSRRLIVWIFHSRYLEVIAISILSFSLSRFFLLFSILRSPTSSTDIEDPLREIYHGVKFIFHFGSIGYRVIVLPWSIIVSRANTFNFFWHFLSFVFSFFSWLSTFYVFLSDYKKFFQVSNSYISYFPLCNFSSFLLLSRARETGRDYFTISEQSCATKFSSKSSIELLLFENTNKWTDI